jgi:hypothetical protein
MKKSILYIGAMGLLTIGTFAAFSDAASTDQQKIDKIVDSLKMEYLKAEEVKCREQIMKDAQAKATADAAPTTEEPAKTTGGGTKPATKPTTKPTTTTTTTTTGGSTGGTTTTGEATTKPSTQPATKEKWNTGDPKTTESQTKWNTGTTTNTGSKDKWNKGN